MDEFKGGEAYDGAISRKGGFKATSFIYAFASLENMGFIANTVSLVLYFHFQLHFDVSSAGNTLTNLMGSTFLLSIFSGFLSDTYINRFKTVIIFGAFELLALVLITIQARYPSLQPEACGQSTCVRGGVAIMLYASLCFLAIGTGGVRGALVALGAEQFDPRNPIEAKAQASYFNWLLLSIVSGATIGVTIIVWVSTDKGWWKGFLICLVVTFLGFLFLVAGKRFYRLRAPGDSPLLRVLQVIVVAIKNMKLELPKNSDQLYEQNYDMESMAKLPKVLHTDQFRWLDKAALLPSNKEATPWTVCTITQIEEVKILTRMLPILLSTIIMNTCLAQLQTFSVQQGYFMNRRIGSFVMPAPSVAALPLLFMTFLLPVYEFIFVPFARKITRNPSGITQLQRVGVGLVLSVISMSAAAMVEVKRKHQSFINPLKPISVFWLAIQFCVFGIADMFTLVGLLDFFYKEAPNGMKSLSTSFTFLSLSMGYFLSSIFVDVINVVTRRVGHGKQGWLEGLYLDMYKLNYFYWFLAILSCLNFFNYLYWSSWYKYKQEDDVAFGNTKEILATKEVNVDDVSKGTTNEVDASKDVIEPVNIDDASKGIENELHTTMNVDDTLKGTTTEADVTGDIEHVNNDESTCTSDKVDVTWDEEPETETHGFTSSKNEESKATPNTTSNEEQGDECNNGQAKTS